MPYLPLLLLLQDSQQNADANTEPAPMTSTIESVSDKITIWLNELILALPNFLVAVVVVIISALLAKLARRIVTGSIARISDEKPTTQSVSELLGTIAYVAVLASGTFIALGILQLDGIVTSLLAGAGIIGLALGFAFQDIASNFIAGILLSVRTPFVNGDLIRSNDYTGVVTDIDLRNTTLTTGQGDTVIIPNASVYQNPLVNYTSTTERRVDLSCGVGYGDDLEKAEQVAVKAAEELAGRDPDKPIKLFYTEFGDSSVNFILQVWLTNASQGAFMDAQSLLIKRLKRAFDDEGITIPFPIRTLDFDPNGGVPLNNVLNTRSIAAGRSN